MTDGEQVLVRARMFQFVREATGNLNAGRWPEAILRVGGSIKGQPWCCAFVCFILGIWYDGNPPFGYTASCDVLLAEARTKGMVVTTPLPGDLFFVMKTPIDAEHVGFVANVTKTTFNDLSGNSNPDGGREGFGVFERKPPRAPRKINGPYVFVRYWK